METAGIARAAAEAGVPLLALRAVSDGPRQPIPVDLAEVMDADANLRLGALLLSLLRHPGLLARAGRVQRNGRLAAGRAAEAVREALRLPEGCLPVMGRTPDSRPGGPPPSDVESNL